MACILISGGTGLIGITLARHLAKAGHQVRILSRQPGPLSGIETYYWNVEKAEIDERAFNGVEHIVHLAGSAIADKRWTPERKREILDSRVNSILLITQVILKKGIILKSFVGASAVGIYGMKTSEREYHEEDHGPRDYLSDTCIAWENAYTNIIKNSERSCILRIGIVLSLKGGALQKLLPLFRVGLGSAVGSGRQYMPWIHLDDLIAIFTESIFNNRFAGIYNAVAPEPVSSREFCRQLAQALHRPFFMPSVPAFTLKLFFGEMAGILLEGSRVSSEKLMNAGFRFRFPSLKAAFSHLLN